MNFDNTARVDIYLDQVLAPLMPHLSRFHQQELRRELRTHLWERISAYRELGQSEDEAVTEALRQFGGANDFLKQWHQEWMKTTSRVTLPEVWQATRLSLPFTLLALLLAQLPEIVADYTFQLDVNGPTGWFYNHYNVIVDVSVCLDFTLPIALGIIIARRMGRSATPALLTALMSICLFGSLMSFTGGYLWEYAVLFRKEVNATTWLAALWIPATCTTAALTGWWTRRSEARRLMA